MGLIQHCYTGSLLLGIEFILLNSVESHQNLKFVSLSVSRTVLATAYDNILNSFIFGWNSSLWAELCIWIIQMYK